MQLLPRLSNLYHTRLRSIGRRALNTLPLEATAAREAMWSTWMELEAKLGGPNAGEAVLKVFREAVQHADGKKMHMAAIKVRLTGEE